MGISRAVRSSYALAASMLMTPAPLLAREDGLAVQDCKGCHAGGGAVDVTITATPEPISLGQKVRLTISIAAGSGGEGGFYLMPVPALGTLAVVSGQQTKLNGAGVTHSAPRQSSGQSVSFAVDWSAPAVAGDIEFFVYGLAADGNGRSSGDRTGSAKLSLAFGCTGSVFYSDYDLDGFGNENDPKRACSLPSNYADRAGDCDDFDEQVHPGAPERCNGRDDDCDGALDEELAIATYCEDKDRDGHGVRGQTSLGCGPSLGFGLCDDDCDDSDAMLFPGADELCNYRDDNCNGRIDEDARSYCGVGWCRRSSEGCENSLCVPGLPRAEECNLLDDDCDDVVDNGAGLCPAGQTCAEGSCAVSGPRTDAGAPAFDGAIGSAGDSGAPTTPEPAKGDSGCATGGSPRDGIAALLALLAAIGARAASRRRQRR